MGFRVAYALALAEKRILLVRLDAPRPEQQWDGHWSPPGGGIDAGESAEEAAIRECREESGALFLPRQPALQLGSDSAGGSLHLILGWAEPSLLLRSQPGETSEAGWFRFEQAQALPLAYQTGALLLWLRRNGHL